MNDEPLLDQVLECYKPHCRYLNKVTVSGDVTASGEFGIGESCYIDDTGHLNAVEVNICYNQLLYFAVAVAVRDRLHPVFTGWTMADYWRRRLPDVLISKLTSRFHRPISSRRFFGEFELTGATRRRLRPDRPPLISLHTAFRFRDDGDGRCDGEVAVAITET
jgi:(3R)-3-[(carboxylmethyl)amino]fatty acid synthase